MISDDTSSFRIPGPGDLKAAGYSQAQAKILATIFAGISQHGPHKSPAIFALFGRSISQTKRRSIEKTIDDAEERGHLATEWAENGAVSVYSLGPDFASIPMAAADEARAPKNGEGESRLEDTTTPNAEPGGSPGKSKRLARIEIDNQLVAVQTGRPLRATLRPAIAPAEYRDHMSQMLDRLNEIPCQQLGQSQRLWGQMRQLLMAVYFAEILGPNLDPLDERLQLSGLTLPQWRRAQSCLIAMGLLQNVREYRGMTRLPDRLVIDHARVDSLAKYPTAELRVPILLNWERYQEYIDDQASVAANGRTSNQANKAGAAAYDTKPLIVYGIVLRGPDQKPLVAGKEKERLSATRYACLFELIVAYPKGLRLNEFPDTIGDPYQALKALIVDDVDFAREIIPPKRSGPKSPGYQLARPGKVESPKLAEP